MLMGRRTYVDEMPLADEAFRAPIYLGSAY